MHRCPSGQPYGLDQACLEISTAGADSPALSLLTKCVECVGCDASVISHHVRNGSSFVMNATFPTVLMVEDAQRSTLICQLEYKFMDTGVYRLYVDLCRVDAVFAPESPDLVVLYAALILLSCGLLWFLVRSPVLAAIFCRLCRDTIDQEPRRNNQSELARMIAEDLGSAEAVQADAASEASGQHRLEQPETSHKRRVQSVDTFRGICILLMVFVNYGGGGFWYFAHSAWNGLTVADLVFPWFLWIMGVSLSITTTRKAATTSRRGLALRVIKRSLALFCLGIVVNSIRHKNELASLRIPGVLQRFGFSYLLIGWLQVAFVPRRCPPAEDSVRRHFADVALIWKQWIVMSVLIALHLALTFCLPVPGCPTGYLGPGGLHDKGLFFNCSGGSAGYIDRLLLSPAHLHAQPSFRRVFGGVLPFDPEGILGGITSSLMVLLGFQAGLTLVTFSKWQSRARRWALWGLILGLIGGGLCGFSKEDGLIPVNKNMWSLTFVLVTSSMAFFFLTVLYLAIDVCGAWGGGPFVYSGMNPILIYLGHEVCQGMLPFVWKPFYRSHAELLAMDIWAAALWALIGFWCYTKRFFVSL